MRYYISDCHFYHRGLNEKMDRRGFADEIEMNEYMIKKWNEKVRENDEVVILGDFSLGNGTQTLEIMDRLRGRLFLIKGNHDGRYLRDKKFKSDRFGWVTDYKEVNDNKRKIIMSHYPIFCYNGQYRLNKEGNPKTYMLYGHVHNTYDEFLVDKFIKETRACRRKLRDESENFHEIPCQMINCFCMFSDYVPLTLDEWIENDRIRREGQTYPIEAEATEDQISK